MKDARAKKETEDFRRSRETDKETPAVISLTLDSTGRGMGKCVLEKSRSMPLGSKDSVWLS